MQENNEKSQKEIKELKDENQKLKLEIENNFQAIQNLVTEKNKLVQENEELLLKLKNSSQI